MSESGNLGNVARGNTETLALPKKSTKFCFTLNNFTSTEVDNLKSNIFYSFIIFGKEIGNSGTPHLQGYFEIKGPRYIKGLKADLPRAHIEIAKGSAEDNIKYCSKEATTENPIYTYGTPKAKHGGKRLKGTSAFREKLTAKVLDEYKNIVWYPWQDHILDIISSKPDPRKIYWVWDNEGQQGKSFFCKYLCAKDKGTILCNGKANDIFNQVNTTIENEIEPTTVLLDIPRTLNGKVPMGTIECLKNGCLYSGKYEGGKCLFPSPHVFIFANFEPDLTELSQDRWEIIDLEDCV